MIIRKETASDYPAVYVLIKEAFQSAEHADGNEQDLVVSLRGSRAFIPELSLVAEIGGNVVGHILFTKAAVGNRPVLALAPLSVKPAFQRQGVGSALVCKGHAVAASLGYSHVLVVGSDQYYPRFGYEPAASCGIVIPGGIPENYVMVAALGSADEPLKVLLPMPKSSAYHPDYHVPFDRQKLRRHMTRSVKISRRPSSMDKHRILLAKADKPA